MSDEFTAEEINHIIDVAEGGDRGRIYGVLTSYAETDAINAVGQVVCYWWTDPTGSDARSVLRTNDGLCTIWASPQGNLWVGSVWGRVWTTANVNWDPAAVAGLQFFDEDNDHEWKCTEIPRRDNGGRFNVAAIHAVTDDDVHIGTFEGRMLRWDGTQWTFTLWENTRPVIRMHGTAANNVWAVGRDGLVLHWGGTQWRTVPLPGDATAGQVLTGVWARSEDEVYICSTSGTIFHGNHHGLERLGEYPHSFYGIVEFGDAMWLAAGDNGVWKLLGNRIEQVKDTFAATGAYRLKSRLAFVEPTQPTPRVIIHNPTIARPWTRWG